MKSYSDTRIIIDQHEQRFKYSCIPSAIEMILKLENRVKSDYYALQKKWGNKTDGNFNCFNEIIIKGVKFYHQFPNKRDSNFPFNDLYRAIDDELYSGRYVAIALPEGCHKGCFGGNFHNFIIFRKNDHNDYEALSKDWEKTILLYNVKYWVRKLGGTDILTYKILVNQ